jgi:hypothetical protein
MENRSFQKMAKKYSSVWVVFLCAIFIACVLEYGSVSMASQNEEQNSNLTVQMEYYQYNVCASCHPEDDFFAVVSEMITPLKEEYPYEIAVYNTFREEDKQRFEKRLQELGLKEAEVSLPALITVSEDSVATVCLSGLDEIREKLTDTLKQAAQAKQSVSGKAADESGEQIETSAANQSETENQTEAPSSQSDWEDQLREAVSKDNSTDSVLLYFSTVSCTDCNEVKTYLKKLTDEQTTENPLVIHEFNIAEGDGVVLIQKLFSLYNVPSDEQQVPIVFFNGGYLSGAKAVTDGLEQLWKDGALTGFDLEKILSEENSAQEEKQPEAAVQTYIGLAATGFINGVNPCGASMLLMLLAAMAMSGRSVLKVGCAYLAGKFAAYCAMGMGLYQLFMAIGQDILLNISQVLTCIFAVVFLVLAILYLIDFINVKQKQYGKIRMQLPAALRKWNHERIEQATNVNARWMIPAAVVLGIIISAGEFFCTGQVYLAAILYMMKMQQERQLQTIAAFLIYVAAMCVPSLLIVLVLEKTKNVIRMSNKTLEWLPAIKLATSVVFLLFAVLMLLQ